MNQVEKLENYRWSTAPQKTEFRHTAAAALIKSGSVLDVGCGDGLLLTMLKEKGITAEGIDISDIGVEECRKKGFTARVGDFASEPLPYPDNAFDTVVALDVLEHVYDPLPLLKELARVSRTHVIIGVPNFSSLPARLQVLLGRVPENNTPNKLHVYWFTYVVLLRIAKKADLIAEAWSLNGVWESKPLIAPIMRSLARWKPSLFALSFVVSYKKKI